MLKWRVSRVHVNPNFRLPPSSVHVNPKFAGNRAPAAPHVNPNFHPHLSDVATRRREEKVQNSVHVNPNFSGRPLPPPPSLAGPSSTITTSSTSTSTHVNPSFLSKRKALDFHARVAKAVAAKTNATGTVFLNPKFGTAKPRAETVAKTNTSPIFKKIGTKKLVRIPRKSSSVKNHEKVLSGSRKLNGVSRASASIASSPLLRSRHRFYHQRSVLQGLLRIRKRATSSPTARSFNRNPFKVDHRKRSPLSKIDHRKGSPPSKATRSEKRASPHAIQQSRQVTVVVIQGNKYKVSPSGKKLCRMSNNDVRSSLAKKVFLEGEEFVEETPGVLVRSRHSLTRQSIASAKSRSIQTILNSQARAKKFCLFYNKFGRCNRHAQGKCPYRHDPEKVAVCRLFLRGSCSRGDACPLRHVVSPDSMPSCKFFLEGVCAKDDCPYRHVKVNPEAAVCQEYLKGFCSRGEECRKQHLDFCPQFEATGGTCPKGPACPLPHKQRRKVQKTFKIAATAPPTREEKPVVVDRRLTVRYFDKEEVEDCDTDSATVDATSSTLQAKRQRLMRKVELAKQGWSGMATTNVHDPDDSGPYEEIPDDDYEDNDDLPDRAPLGALPAFIPLKHEQETEDEENYSERLI